MAKVSHSTYEANSGSISQNLHPYSSRTEVGYVREHNEDSMLVAPPLFVVCDGMGGHEAGEVASEIAADTISRLAPSKLDVDALGHAVEEANLAIIDAADKGIGREGMGTTCTAAMLEGEHLAIAQVGDSRAYLLHDGALQQLTRDHSVVADLVESGEITPAEARTHQWRSFITRALGLEPYTKPDLYELDVEQGDRLMICSDGLYSMVSDMEIETIMSQAPNTQVATDLLTEAALDAGGSDNITVIVADVTGYNMQKHKKAVKRSRMTGLLIIAAMLVIIGLAIGSLAFVMNTAAYLADVDGKVAIYKGIPGDLFGITTSSLYEVTDVNTDDVKPGTAERIKSLEIRCDTIDEAQGLIEEYKQQIAEDNSSAVPTQKTEEQDSEAQNTEAQDAENQDANKQNTDAQNTKKQSTQDSSSSKSSKSNTKGTN